MAAIAHGQGGTGDPIVLPFGIPWPSGVPNPPPPDSFSQGYGLNGNFYFCRITRETPQFKKEWEWDVYNKQTTDVVPINGCEEETTTEINNLRVYRRTISLPDATNASGFRRAVQEGFKWKNNDKATRFQSCYAPGYVKSGANSDTYENIDLRWNEAENKWYHKPGQFEMTQELALKFDENSIGAPPPKSGPVMTPIGKLAGSAAYKDSTMIVVSDASLAFEYDEVRWSLERVNPTASDAKFWPSSNANLAPQGTSIQVLTVPNWMPPTFSQLFGYSNAENFRNLVTNGGYQLQATQPSWPQP